MKKYVFYEKSSSKKVFQSNNSQTNLYAHIAHQGKYFLALLPTESS